MEASSPKQTLLLPAPGAFPNVKADAQAVSQVLLRGGIAICPTEVGYGLFALSSSAISLAFSAKKRRPGHSHGVIGTWALHRSLHVLPEERYEMTRVLTEDMDMGFGIVAPFRADHPILGSVSKEDLERCTKGGTLAMFVGGSSFLREFTRLLIDDALEPRLVIGSSANLTGQGQKFRVEDIEPEIKEVADVIVDYGLQRYHVYGGRASINFGFGEMKVLRMGSQYELFRERMGKWWGVELPEDTEFGYKKDREEGKEEEVGR